MTKVTSIGTFPFGQPVVKVVQTDRTAKRVFVLGVYASAVHAHWKGIDDRTIVRALAIASEPYIFWHGKEAESVIQRIYIPKEVGRLVPASPQYNGPSGIALDELILKPLGLKRDDAWLCDLVPHSCMNPNQAEAIKRHYMPLAQKYHLPLPTVPLVPKMLTDETRREAILGRFREAGSGIIILLGDKPIQWFLKFYDKRWNSLRDFGSDNETYGRLHPARIDGMEVKILPLAHPRQIAKLGQSSRIWYNLHQTWVRNNATKVLSEVN